MKSLLALVVVGLLAVSYAEDSGEPSDVIALDASNFDAQIAAHELLLVEFYAPWCGHCKHLAPEYEKAATELKSQNLHIAKIDADTEENKPLAQRYGIRGFPTIKLFRKGASADYQGERTAAGIASFMRKQALPAITILKDAEEVKGFQSQSEVVVVGFFNARDGEEYNAFKAAADGLRDNYVFAEVIGNAAAAKELGVTVPGVLVLKTFDERQNILAADDWKNLNKFITTSATPLIDEIGPNNYKRYMEAGTPLVYAFVNVPTEGQLQDVLDKVRSVAQGSKGKLNWVYIDSAKYAKHGERLGLSGKVVPALAIEKPESGVHYAFDETAEITTAAVQKWVDSFLSGDLQPTVKSEEIPADNSGPVKVVVAKSFEQIVLDTSKDVLLEFYAPWCGHCKHLTPIYEELGTTLSGSPGIVIAKIDATANDVDGKYGVRGFPTIKFFPANNKGTPIDYEGDRTHDDFVKFLKQHATTPVNVAAGSGSAASHESHDEL